MGFHQNHTSIRVAVVIATRNRCALLANRALRSVVEQTRPPDRLIVVDDSDRRFLPDNRRIVASVALPGCNVVYRTNDRTPGACGAWNVAIDMLHREEQNRHGLFVAVLDDDDAWEPEYLERCVVIAEREGADMVAAGISRYESSGEFPVAYPAPAQLNASAFLVGNPGIQGSNLFVRLSTLLAAGLFDEALQSSTDRDVCIRIADLGVAYRHVPALLVRHYADRERPRLTSAGSAPKLAGLDGFWRKYASRMRSDERAAFAERAHRLFGWQDAGTKASGDRRPAVGDDAEPQPVDLVVGVIVDLGRAERATALMQELVLMRADPGIAALTVVLLENSPGNPSSDGSVLTDGLEAAGIGCVFVPVDRQQLDAQSGLFGEPFQRPGGMVSIATARTMLQTYVYLRAKPRTGSVAWILDGDARLQNLVCGADGIGISQTFIGKTLGRLKNAGIDIALGTMTDAPPVPFASCIRTQLVDVAHNLFAMAALDPHEPWPDRHAENMRVRSRCDDYYYDLSRRDTDHLETPFWFVPSRPGATVAEAFREMVLRLPRMLAGEQVFRPLLLEQDVDPLALAKPSVHRGGNTFVFDIESLRVFPNAAPTVGGSETRRSDMIWSLLNRYIARRNVVKVPVAVRQDRSDEQPGSLDLEKLAKDIQGYAIYSALEDLLLDHHECAQQNPRHCPPALDTIRADALLDRMRKYFRERLAAFSLSYHRAAGIAQVLECFTGDPPAAGLWWAEDPEYADSADALKSFAAHLRDEFDLNRLADFEARVPAVGIDIVERFLDQLRADVAARAKPSPAMDEANRWMNRQRAETAGRQVSAAFGASDLRLLGMGAEGVALTDGRRVFKCIDYWKTRWPDVQLAFLREQVGRWEGLPGLYELAAVEPVSSFVVITYEYEPSSPYRGGHGPSLLALLESCRRARVVCNNVHPENLVVTADGVKLIDYGADVRPYSDDAFLHMARRAYLSWRWAEREDLKLLMRRALREHDIPELEGFEQFWTALQPTSKEQLVDERLVALLGEGEGRSLLDYGCGKAKLGRSLAALGWSVTGYDPDPDLVHRWHAEGDGIRLGGQPVLHELRERRARFDTVVCSLVLCLLDGRDLEDALHDVERFTMPGGRLVVVVCNPEYVCGTTQIQRRVPPSDVGPDDMFRLDKWVFSSGRTLIDVHRPLEHYLQAFERMGFEVRWMEETPAVDTETFEASSDFLILDMVNHGEAKHGRDNSC